MDVMSVYFHSLERHLDCPKRIRRPFLTKTRQSAEDFIRGKPDATQQDVIDYLGEPQELAQGFLEGLDPDVLKRYHKKKKYILRSCVAVIIAALIGVSVWCYVLWHTPDELEVTGTTVIYYGLTEGKT